jgi:hypothetical protein
MTNGGNVKSARVSIWKEAVVAYFRTDLLGGEGRKNDE